MEEYADHRIQLLHSYPPKASNLYGGYTGMTGDSLQYQYYGNFIAMDQPSSILYRLKDLSKRLNPALDININDRDPSITTHQQGITGILNGIFSSFKLKSSKSTTSIAPLDSQLTTETPPVSSSLSIENVFDFDGVFISKAPSSFITKYSTFSKLSHYDDEDEFFQLFGNKYHTKQIHFLFYYYGNLLVWRNLFAFDQEEPLLEVQFNKICITSLSYEIFSSSETVLMLIGFSNGEIMILHLYSLTYLKFNKNGLYCNKSVTTLGWIPDSNSHFLAGFSNGTIVIFDIFKDEIPLSYTSTEPLDMFHVVHPNRENNPMSIWHISLSAITGTSFSPNARHLAIVSKDGHLRIVDLYTEKLIVTYSSYYGGLLNVAWSFDGLLVLTGGEDDLVSVWQWENNKERGEKLICRGQGHQSFVSCLRFLSEKHGCYRWLSSGQDGALCEWEFDPCSLPELSMETNEPRLNENFTELPSPSTHQRGSFQLSQIHRAPSLTSIPFIRPLKIFPLDSEPITCFDIVLQSSILITRNATGIIKIYKIIQSFY